MIWTIIVGFFVGLVAKIFMPGRDPGGFIITILLGIFGAAFAGWLGERMGYYTLGEGPGFIASVLGAMALLYIYRLLKAKPA